MPNINETVEMEVLNQVVKNGTMYHLLDILPMGNSFYKLNLSVTDYRQTAVAYAHVSATKNSTMVFVFLPSSKFAPYMAFWVRDGELTRLVEKKTLGYAERILTQIVTVA